MHIFTKDFFLLLRKQVTAISFLQTKGLSSVCEPGHESMQSAQIEERAEETYHDAEFYQALLNEFLEGKSDIVTKKLHKVCVHTNHPNLEGIMGQAQQQARVCFFTYAGTKEPQNRRSTRL